MSAYTPRPGSVAERSLHELQARGARSGAILADELDIDATTLGPCLKAAIDHGCLKREKRDGVFWYDVGDGTAPLAEQPTKQPIFTPKKAKGLDDALAQIGAAVAPKPEADGLAPGHDVTRMRVALWSDGQLHICRSGGNQVVFQREETRQIVGYLDSISLDVVRGEGPA